MWHNTCSGSNSTCDIVACGPPVILPHVVVPNSHLSDSHVVFDMYFLLTCSCHKTFMFELLD